MKKLFFTVLMVFLIPVSSFAITYTFSPSPSDLYDLSGRNYYNWGIYQVLDGSEILSADITFSNIVNLYGNIDLDVLHLNLLDNTAHFVGLQVFSDSSNLGNAFAGQPGAVHLASVYGIPVAIPPGPINYTYNFTAAQLSSLYNFTRDGYFGLGIDPQCHYFNDGITFTINTARVPEPGTVLLIGVGLIGIGIFGRKRFIAKA